MSDGKRVWAKEEQPLGLRVARQTLFGAKWMLSQWGYVKTSMWVDEDTFTLHMGNEKVLKAIVVDGALKVEYGTGWEDYLTSAEWKKILQESQDTFSRSTGKKGVGKGKGKVKGKTSH